MDDFHVHHLADQPRVRGDRCGEIHHAIVFRAPREFVRVLACRAFDQNPLDLADHRIADALHVFFDRSLQMLQTFEFHFTRRVVVQIRGGRAGTRAVDEREAGVVFHLVNQRHHLVEVFFGLAGEADNHVGRQGQVRADRAQLADHGLVFEHRVATLHCHQDAVGAVLHRQMQMADELRHLGVGVDQALREFLRVRRGIANPFDARDIRDVFDQLGEVGDFGRAERDARTVSIHVLAEQRDFTHALVGETGDFGQHVVQRARHFFATRIRHDAVAAVLAATFHDRHERARTVDARRRQVIELFDFRERDVDLRAAALAAFVDHLRQTVQRLRTEHQIDIRRARYDRRAFLACHAAAHADDQIRIRFLQLAHAAEIGENFFLRFFAHRARVEQNDVRVFRRVGLDESFSRAEYVDHLVGVVLIHLAAKGFYINFLDHRFSPVAVVNLGASFKRCRGGERAGSVRAARGMVFKSARAGPGPARVNSGARS